MAWESHLGTQKVNFMKISRYILIFASFLLLREVALADCKQCVKLDFGKQIELPLLEPMLRMNLREKIDYVQKYGIQVFRVKDSENLPVTVPFLPIATEHDIPTKFLKAFADGGLGQYMTPKNLNYGVTKPTMLLIESVDHWTIVHEFAHFLFERARLMSDDSSESLLLMSSEDAFEDYMEAKNIYQDLRDYRDENHKARTVQSFVLYARTQLFFVRTNQLEETTIEKMLRQYYVGNRPTGFTDWDYNRSGNYIYKTSTDAQESLRLLVEDCEFLKRTLHKGDEKLMRPLVEVCRETKALKQEARQVYQAVGLDKQLAD
ncbi:MAG: hypothetical protein ACM3MG_12770 [Bacillota bacterium]